MKRLLTNQRDQPVELHLHGGVTVVGPRQTVEIDEHDTDSPQLGVLLRRRHLTIADSGEAPHGQVAAKGKPVTHTASAAHGAGDSAKKATRGTKPGVKGDE